jgi:hypothetical protein
MADLKISQLPAAGPITGNELTELVQNGTNVQSTVTAALGSAPVAPVILTNVNAQAYVQLIDDQSTGAIVPGFQAGGGTNTIGQWITGGTTGTQFATPSATTLGAAVGNLQVTSTAAINSFIALRNNNMPTTFPAYRKISGGLPIAGFNEVYVGLYKQTRSDQTAFVGMSGQAFNTGTLVPSGVFNCIGFGKDQGDTNLQFMVNNGAGSAAKTDTGIVFTSLENHLFQVTIACDPAGALITATFKDLEAGGQTKIYTVADGATKNIVVDTALAPWVYACTGSATATSVKMGIVSMYVSIGLIGS